MQSFSTGIMLADVGAAAWDSRQENPSLNAPIPSVTYKQQKFLDEVSKLEEENFNYLYSLENLFMKYKKTTNPYMGYGDKPRPNNVNQFVKGFHVGNGSLANNLDGMIWGSARSSHVQTIEVDCSDKLNKPNGICSCPRHTWMYGQSFPNKKADRYLNGWTKNYCSHKIGYTHKNICKLVDIEGKNAWTACPANMYIVGIGRGADSQGKMDKAKLKCCELEYNEALEGSQKLPSEYYSADNKWIGFRTSDGLKYMSSDASKVTANNGAFDAKAKLKIEQFSESQVNKWGYHHIKTSTNKYWACTPGSNELLVVNKKDEKTRNTGFQFIKKDDGVVIYNPQRRKFLVYDEMSKNILCMNTFIDQATTFKGPKIPYKDIEEHLFYPELFRT